MTKKYVDDNSGGGNPFDQDLNTTDVCNFAGYKLGNADVEVARGSVFNSVVLGVNALGLISLQVRMIIF